jgi:hypothetical protein
MPRHVARLVTRLIVDYFASHRLVVDYFAYAVRSGASACRAARHAARCRLLRLRRMSGCLRTSRGSSSTASTTPRVRVLRHVERLVARLVVDYFAYAARPGASARRAARHATPRRLLRLRHASGCLGTSWGSSSTTSTTPCVRLLRHVAPLVVDYFTYTARLGASASRAAHHAARRRLLRAPRLLLAATLALLQPRRASRLLVWQEH